MNRTHALSFIPAVATLSLLQVVSSSILASPLPIHPDSIHSLGLPVITIETVDGEEPTCERADPPEEEGAVGMGITNATKVPGRLCITLGGDTLYDSGPYVKGAAGMRVKIRGNSSAWTPKKPYKVKLERSADLLLRSDDGQYGDKDWLLLKDPKLLQSIGFETSRLIGMKWTPGRRYVNLVMNGDYRGLYLLCEPVERNTRCRIDVGKTGYIAESDAYFWCEDFYIPSSLNPFGWTLKYPDADDVTEEQVSFLTRELAQLEEALSSDSFAGRIDVESFARWLLAHDILGTWDSYGSNLFFARSDTLGSKARMPVLWDFDGIMLMQDDWAKVHFERFYFSQLFASGDPAFREAYLGLWSSLRRRFFDGMLSYIDEYAASEEARAVDASMRLDAVRWRGEYTSLGELLAAARTWFESREPWLAGRIKEEIGDSGIDSTPCDSAAPPGPALNAWGIPVGDDYRGISIRGGKKFIIVK